MLGCLLLLVPLAVQWWASYYPGAEPGGGGYIAQRMFSAKDETNAVGATLLFNIAHYAIRPWPWILIALASLIVFPELSDIKEVFTALSDDKVGHDIAYPAMLTLLPSGLLGFGCCINYCSFYVNNVHSIKFRRFLFSQ